MYNFLKLFVAFWQFINKTLVNSHYVRKTVVANQRLINFDDLLNDAGKPVNFLHYFVNDVLKKENNIPTYIKYDGNSLTQYYDKG